MSSPAHVTIFAFTALILTLLFSSATAQTCKTYKFTTNANFAACIDLPVLNSFLHYTYTNTTNKLQIAYRHTNVATSTWVAWAINPTRLNMVGSQAIVVLVQSDSSIKAYTSPVTNVRTLLAQGELSFPVDSFSAVYENKEIVILATMTLPNNQTTLNQLWQSGPVTNGNPTQHSLSADNTNSKSTLDVLSGLVSASSDTRESRKKLSQTHGILNTVSWGVMMLIAFLLARVEVSRSADSSWFYLHASCQFAAFVIGLAGFATGIKLGNETVGIVNTHHRNLGIALVTVASLQVLALFLHPKLDHKHRPAWSLYHCMVGFTVIMLSIVNVIEGFVLLLVTDRNRAKTTNEIFTWIGVAAQVLIWIVVIMRGKKHGEVGYGNAGRQQA